MRSAPLDGYSDALVYSDQVGLWTRPGTFDAVIVTESEAYLSLDARAPDVLLDVGANIGAVTVRFLRKAIKHVVALEPEPANFSLLEMNTARLGPQVTLIRAAAARNAGTQRLWLNPGGNRGMHSLAVRRSNAYIRVPCRALTT